MIQPSELPRFRARTFREVVRGFDTTGVATPMAGTLSLPVDSSGFELESLTGVVEAGNVTLGDSFVVLTLIGI